MEARGGSRPQPRLRGGFGAVAGRHGFFVFRERLVFKGRPANTPPVSIPASVQCPSFHLGAAPEQPPAPLFFKDGSIYQAVNYQVESGCLHYRTSYGGENTVPLALLDLKRTRLP